MRRLVILAVAGAFFASPVLAQQQPARTPAPASTPVAQQTPAQPAPRQPAAPQAQPQAQVQARTGFGASHALALGVGMFGGAVLGSAMIHGGSFAAAVGAVAGLTAGHWYYTQHGQAPD
jgi:hypothetical protein